MTQTIGPIEDMYFDRTGHPATVGPFGGFRMTLAYDAEGNITEIAFFDEHGKAMPGNEGYHRRIRKFENGREVHTKYSDGDGKLVAIKGGYAAIDRTFDTQGNEVRTAYFGLDNRPVPNRNEGFAIKRTSFDACGRETEKRFLDEHEHPVRRGKGMLICDKPMMKAIMSMKKPTLTKAVNRFAPSMAMPAYSGVRPPPQHHRRTLFRRAGQSLIAERSLCRA